RVPMIAKWKGKITAGTTTNHPSAFWDVLPTFADVLKVDTTFKTDGISFLPTLLHQKNQKKHDYLYWEFHELNGRQAVLKDNWKLVKYNVKTKPEYFLFDLQNDIEEKNDVKGTNTAKLEELKIIMANARTASEDFKF
ncbi:sulfatase/phosphatase domain-containing protein, partial [Polaribacter atrinae]|uniref:sulfatase/phosphatase domain-containing protein n=1 Tax=Polaribacter atrinae TaxID=1333662 RepID=UPI002490C266